MICRCQDFWCSHLGFLSNNSLTVILSWWWGRYKGASVHSGCSRSCGHCLTEPTQNSRSVSFFLKDFVSSLSEMTHLPWGPPNMSWLFQLPFQKGKGHICRPLTNVWATLRLFKWFEVTGTGNRIKLLISRAVEHVLVCGIQLGFS